MNTRVNIEVDADRLRQASEWVQRLADSVDNDQAFVEWQRWCDADPANIRLFEQMQEVWDGLAPSRVARVTSTTVPRRRSTPLALAAAVLLAVGAALWIGTAFLGAQQFQTDIGEIRQEILPDGSRLDLSADSRVTMRYSGEQRDLRLEKGRAFFVVARDAARPFVVHAGGLKITAVGTAFDIRTGPSNTIVTVGEGRVKIVAEEGARSLAAGRLLQPLHADAGQRVSYSKPARALTVKRVDPQLTESWRRGVLQFQEEPLQDVVSEVNRYTPRKIVLDDADLGRAPFTGTISPERVDDWLIALEKILPVTVKDRGPDGISIARRRSAPAGE